MKVAALLLIVLAGALTVWSGVRKPDFRATIRVNIGQSVPDARQAAAILHTRTVAQAALEGLSPVSRTVTPDALIRRVEVRPVPSTRLVELVARGGDPGRASADVNALADAYIRYTERTGHESNASALSALAGDRLTHERALTDAHARLNRQRDAAATADTNRALIANAFVRREMAYQRALDVEPDYRRMARAPALLSASPIANDPGIQILQMRASVLEGGRTLLAPPDAATPSPASSLFRPIDVAADVAQQDLGLRARQLADGIRDDFEAARTAERLAQNDIDALTHQLTSTGGRGTDIAATAASIVAEEAALEAIHAREVALHLDTSDTADTARIVDATIAEDTFWATFATLAWFAAAIAILADLLLIAWNERTPRRRYMPHATRPARQLNQHGDRSSRRAARSSHHLPNLPSPG